MLPLSSGSCGNSFYFEFGETRLLVDVGIPPDDAEARLAEIRVPISALNAAFITHEHADHVSGLEGLLKRHPMPVFMSPKIGRLQKKLADQEFTTFPLQANSRIPLGEVLVTPFPLPHDAAAPFGFLFQYRDFKAVCCTDLGHASSAVREAMNGVNLAVIESNHDPVMLQAGPYPDYLKKRVASRIGHLSNQQTGELLATMKLNGGGPVVTYLAHLSEINNTPDLAMETVGGMLKSARREARFELRLAPRAAPGQLFQSP